MDVEVNVEDECEGNGSDGSLRMILHNEGGCCYACNTFTFRHSILLLNSSKGKPPRSFLATASSSSSSIQRFGKPNPFKGGGNKKLQTVGENEIPDILEDDNNGSPISGVKSRSPNSKRVSPPHLGQRSSRKLILQSIPSFPCLTPNPKQQ